MDGLKETVNRSLQSRLSLSLAAAILIFAVAAALLSFRSAYDEAIELQDDQLDQMAELIHRHSLSVGDTIGQFARPGIESENRMIVQMLGPIESLSAQVPDKYFRLPTDLKDGFRTIDFHRESWRVFVRTLKGGSRVALAQQSAVRDEIARASALWTLVPFLALIPVLYLIVGELVREMFKPIRELASEVDNRSDTDLTALGSMAVPSEVFPFIVAINHLLARVSDSVSRQRRFVADAAHELRSPLTALSLQAERLASADMSKQARDRLETLQSGLRRTRALVEQLLSFAHALEPPVGRTEPLQVRRIFHQVLEDLIPMAQIKNIDLGLVDASDAVISTTDFELRTLIRNLIDNAIRFTPPGGTIDLSIRAAGSHVLLQFDDSGPGIPVAERDRVFDPFYRIVGSDEIGSGLGLSIVKAIAIRAFATVTLDWVDPSGPSGLRVVVDYPGADDSGGPIHLNADALVDQQRYGAST